MTVAEQCTPMQAPLSTEAAQQFVGILYERYNASLRGYLVNNLHNEADAEDFAQEVYLRLSRMKDHSGILSNRAFLFTTATNLLRDKSRRLATQLDKASVSLDNVSLQCTSGDPADRIQHAEELATAHRAIGSLNDNCRKAFWLSRIDGLSYPEIANVMGVSVSMVEKHISQALRRLREFE